MYYRVKPQLTVRTRYTYRRDALYTLQDVKLIFPAMDYGFHSTDVYLPVVYTT
jgi:hypothetical protein